MVIYLDTSALVWLHTKKLSSFNPKILKLIEDNKIITGEINILELEFLYEIRRINYSGSSIFDSLKSSINLELVSITSEVMSKAMGIKWTRDVFDRITVAGAMTYGAKLVTKDSNILDNFDLAVW